MVHWARHYPLILQMHGQLRTSLEHLVAVGALAGNIVHAISVAGQELQLGRRETALVAQIFLVIAAIFYCALNIMNTAVVAV